MCLIAAHFRPKISFKRIKVYKLVLFEDGKLITPHRRSELLKKAEGPFKFPVKDTTNGEYIIEGGMIHAYYDKSEAIFHLELAKLKSDAYLIKAYIPPFTRYYIGKFGDICARRMKYSDL